MALTNGLVIVGRQSTWDTAVLGQADEPVLCRFRHSEQKYDDQDVANLP